MNCEQCGTGTQTKDTRKIDLGVWRRRVCPKCGDVSTTLEQKCETIASPYRSSKTGKNVEGAVVAPDVPAVPRPNPPEKRSYATRRSPIPRRTTDKPAGTQYPAPADFAPRPKETQYNVGRVAPVPVDRITPTARDRIEDMKAEREMDLEYGWGK